MKTKKIAITMATAALYLGGNVNNDAAMAALRDMAGEFENLIPMSAPVDYPAALMKETSTGLVRKFKGSKVQKFNNQ